MDYEFTMIGAFIGLALSIFLILTSGVLVGALIETDSTRKIAVAESFDLNLTA